MRGNRTIGIARVPDPHRLRAPEGRPPMVIEAGERFYFKAEGPSHDPRDLLVSRADETPSAPVDARPDDLDVAHGFGDAGEEDLPARDLGDGQGPVEPDHPETVLDDRGKLDGKVA